MTVTRLTAAAFVLAALIILPVSSRSDENDCVVVYSCPCAQRCEVSGWGILIDVHADDYECFQVRRKLCGYDWVLIYEGPSDTFCDCGYDPTGKYLYRVTRLEDASCSTAADSCETDDWITGSCQTTDCP